MLVTYLRSSSIGTFYQCEMKYFGEYILGIKSEPRLRTVMGSMFHKVMESLALREQAIQNGRKTFTPSELGRFPIVTNSTNLIEKSFNYYASRHPEHTWTEKEKKELTKWVQSVIMGENGEFDPANLNILDVEKYFDITIEEEWAKLDGGYLSLKGTIDLIVDRGDHIEVIDWKTGQRKNWVTGATKEYEDFRDDKQLLLYYYVAHHIYNKPITITIVYVNSGGSFTMDFNEIDYTRAGEMIRASFEEIKSVKKPSLIRPARFCSFCPLYKTHFDSPQTWPNGDKKDKCYQLKSEIYSIGMAQTMKKHSVDDYHIHNYTEGGGRENKK